MNDELERFWKEEVMVQLRFYPGICLEGLNKITKTSIRVVSVPSRIQNEHLLNTSLTSITATPICSRTSIYTLHQMVYGLSFSLTSDP
jgi:antibiotic biosynthesis monooxygenase (ABM) superfamily enzyme